MTIRATYTVSVTTDLDDVETVPAVYVECHDGAPCTCASGSADSQARMLTAVLSGTNEPQPARVTHDVEGSTYTTSGHSEVFGAWAVRLTVRDVPLGPQCLACGDDTCLTVDAHHIVTTF